MSGIETKLVEMAKRLPIKDGQVLYDAVRWIQEHREVNDRLRRENEALRLDIHFLDKEKNGG